MPLYCSRVKLLHGEYVVDGAYGFKGTDLPHGDDTLFIGIDPHAEITRTFTNAQMFYPAVGAEYDEVALSGYNAFKEWAATGKKIRKVGSRRPNYEALIVLWFMKLFEIIMDILEALFITVPGFAYKNLVTSNTTTVLINNNNNSTSTSSHNRANVSTDNEYKYTMASTNSNKDAETVTASVRDDEIIDIADVTVQTLLPPQ